VIGSLRLDMLPVAAYLPHMGSINRTALKAWRKQRGLSVRELAELAGIDDGYLSRIETGDRNNPSEAIILRIAEALRVDVGAITNWCSYCRALIAS
jgi:transcriptional regulator with XRE-family HTH domain